jgi:putative ABC transport system permease protein
MFSISMLVRLVLRDMRGSVRHFRLFVLAIMLGVGAIASVGFLSDSLTGGLKNDARKLLGGDVSIRLNQRVATDEERAWLEAEATVSHITTFRSMARTSTSQRLVEVKAVDAVYPLVDVLETTGKSSISALHQTGSDPATLTDKSLAVLLDVKHGDQIKIGDSSLTIKDWIEREPDRTLNGFELGPRVMISHETLAKTGLLREGSLTRNNYRVLLDEGVGLDDWMNRLKERFPEAGWRVRSVSQAAPAVRDTLERLTLFLTLVGLTTLLASAVGSANAVNAWLERKAGIQATFKTLGAGRHLLFWCFFAEVFVMALIASLLGIALGYIGARAAIPFLEEVLNIKAVGNSPMLVTALSLAYGILIAITFSLPALGRVPSVPTAQLFRGNSGARGKANLFSRVTTVVLTLVLVTLALWTATDFRLAAWFIIAVAVTLALLWGLSRTLVFCLKKLPGVRGLTLRMAVSNLTRPGSPTTSTILSLGLGLTLLTAIAGTDINLRRQVTQEFPDKTPAFYLIDIQKQDEPGFRNLVNNLEGASGLKMVPMLRGGIKSVKGVAVQDLTIPEEIEWVFRGDRGLTWAREPSADMKVVEGDWWPADYSGKPLISLDQEVGQLMGINLGDKLGINILGRDIEVEVANFREINWRTFGINFVIVFSPGLLEKAPQSFLATINADEADEDRIEKTIVDAFPAVSSIRVKRTLNEVSGLLGKVATMLSMASLLTLVVSIIVISGAILTNRQKRAEEMVVMKVLGATRKQITRSFLVEYGLMGFLAAILAAVLGSTGAFLVVTELMDGDYEFDLFSLSAILLIGTLTTMVIGFLGTWRSLSLRPADFLRNE